MDWQNAFLKFFSRPKVIHGTPGRLRVHIDTLRKIPRERQEIVRIISELVSAPPGVRDVEICLITGNLLIRYDEKKYRQEDLLLFLQSLMEIFLKNKEHFLSLDAEKTPQVAERLKTVLLGAVEPPLNLDPKVEIPKDVFA